MGDMLILVAFFVAAALFILWVFATVVNALKPDEHGDTTQRNAKPAVTKPNWAYETEPAPDLPPLLVPGDWNGRGKTYRRAAYAVVDVETTGFSAGVDRVVEIAVVRADRDGRVLTEWSTTVNPGNASGAENIHGLSAADLVSSPRFEDIADELLAHLSEAIIVAHNYSFESRFLRSEFQHAGVSVDPLPAICTLQLARRAFPHFRKHSMEHCCKELNITNSLKHSALGDAVATVSIMRAALPLAPRPKFSVPPLPYRTVDTTRAAPRGTAPGQPTPVVQPGRPIVHEPMSLETIGRELVADGFAPAASYPHGYVLHTEDGIVAVTCASDDAEIAERETKRIAKSLRDAGYVARMGRQSGLPRVTVKAFSES